MPCRYEVDVITGQVSEVQLTPEEIAAAPGNNPNDEIRAQIDALQAQFTTTMQMRVAIGDQTAIATTTSLLQQIDALKAQLQ